MIHHFIPNHLSTSISFLYDWKESLLLKSSVVKNIVGLDKNVKLLFHAACILLKRRAVEEFRCRTLIC
jgi:hypothetical protein